METEPKTVMVYFPASKVERRYGTLTAPLRRIQFMTGDEIRLQDGSTHMVTDVQEKNGLMTYLTAAGAVADRRQQPRDPRLQAGALVPGLRLLAGRSRSRVPGQDQLRDRCRFRRE
mgnify:CR=1 FL=1